MTAAGAVTGEFAVPTTNSGPSGIAAGSDGNTWFTEDAGNKVAQLSPAGVVLHEFAIPTANSRSDFIVLGPDGNLWFTESSGNKIGRITTAGAITEYNSLTIYTVPTDSLLQGVTAGPDGNMWFCENGALQIGRANFSIAVNPAGHHGGLGHISTDPDLQDPAVTVSTSTPASPVGGSDNDPGTAGASAGSAAILRATDCIHASPDAIEPLVALCPGEPWDDDGYGDGFTAMPDAI
jgi:hypothetical protein